MITKTIIIIFSSLLVWAAVSDARHYILSNKVSMSILGLYPLFLFSLHLNGNLPAIEYIGYSVLIALTIFCVLLAFFAYGFLGGGDVKLIPIVALWAGPSLTVNFLLITAICGGIISLIIISYRVIQNVVNQYKSNSTGNYCMSLSLKTNDEEDNIPYGVAISAGGLFIAFDLYQALN